MLLKPINPQELDTIVRRLEKETEKEAEKELEAGKEAGKEAERVVGAGVKNAADYRVVRGLLVRSLLQHHWY